MRDRDRYERGGRGKDIEEKWGSGRKEGGGRDIEEKGQRRRKEEVRDEGGLKKKGDMREG